MEVLTVTKSEVIKEFFKKSVLPVAVAALLYCIFKSACTKDGVTDYVWLFILAACLLASHGCLPGSCRAALWEPPFRYFC